MPMQARTTSATTDLSRLGTIGLSIVVRNRSS
jgi:hypothetical protein